MTHPLASNRNDGAVAHNDRAHRGGYRFGRSSVRPHRRSWKRVKRWFDDVLATIAAAKLRRIRRELELRGVRQGRSSKVWIALSTRQDSR